MGQMAFYLCACDSLSLGPRAIQLCAMNVRWGGGPKGVGGCWSSHKRKKIKVSNFSALNGLFLTEITKYEKYLYFLRLRLYADRNRSR